MTAVFRHGALRLYLLKLLSEQPRHGYEVISLLEDRFFGLYAPSAGTVYPRLAKLEAEGLIEHEEVDGRKIYSLTEAGRAELARNVDALRTLEEDLSRSVAEMAQEVRSQVRASVRDLRAELKQAAREVRRESRARVRSSAAQPKDPLTDSIGTEFDAVRDELLDIVRETGASAAEIVRDVLRQARKDMLAAMDEVRDR
ncbi:MAG TPA: PadR family transcriptional regulator [Mycobacteriales bacterium]|jgi:DNA-binding PadR family transcriptional regulator|nr:PadR family transcriptional regulator [Mycobacteriales bacterium]